MQPLSKARQKFVRSLHRGKGRRQAGAYLVEGMRAVSEMAHAPGAPLFVFGTADRLEALGDTFAGVERFVVEAGEDLFATEHAQGIGCVVEMPPPAVLEQAAHGAWPLLYLDRIADPGNLGTILRTANWFGVRAMLLGPGCADPYSPKAVRATMGALPRLTLVPDVQVDQLVRFASDTAVPIIALDAGGYEQLGIAELGPRAVYAVGSEAHGLHPHLRAAARLLAIAGGGEGESLNAAAAASILLYEIARLGAIELP